MLAYGGEQTRDWYRRLPSRLADLPYESGHRGNRSGCGRSANTRVLDNESSATHIAIDIPIGLPEAGRSRKVDREARKLLTSARASSVFSAPARELLDKLIYAEANGHSKAVCGKGIS